MSELEDLYQEVILDHGRKPRNFHRLDGERIADAAFEGAGCAISKASASLMTGAVKGMTVADADRLFEQVHALVTEGPEKVKLEELGKLAVLKGVWAFPTRVKCASLAWHALRNALHGQAQVASTE
jgi:nitrogen fixation NifU-like protein